MKLHSTFLVLIALVYSSTSTAADAPGTRYAYARVVLESGTWDGASITKRSSNWLITDVFRLPLDFPSDRGFQFSHSEAGSMYDRSDRFPQIIVELANAAAKSSYWPSGTKYDLNIKLFPNKESGIGTADENDLSAVIAERRAYGEKQKQWRLKLEHSSFEIVEDHSLLAAHRAEINPTTKKTFENDKAKEKYTKLAVTEKPKPDNASPSITLTSGSKETLSGNAKPRAAKLSVTDSKQSVAIDSTESKTVKEKPVYSFQRKIGFASRGLFTTKEAAEENLKQEEKDDAYLFGGTISHQIAVVGSPECKEKMSMGKTWWNCSRFILYDVTSYRDQRRTNDTSPKRGAAK